MLLFDNLVVTSEIFLPAQDCAKAGGIALLRGVYPSANKPQV